MRSICILALVLLIGGCSPQPITSSGQPATYWFEQVKSPDPKLRQKAVKALGHLANHEAEVMPALIAAIDDPDANVRAEAVLALLNIGPPASEATPSLEKATRDENERVRRLAVKALERIRGPGS
jgi:HEAT repeat protein